jgi:hypothetical protein
MKNAFVNQGITEINQNPALNVQSTAKIAALTKIFIVQNAKQGQY